MQVLCAMVLVACASPTMVAGKIGTRKSLSLPLWFFSLDAAIGSGVQQQYLSGRHSMCFFGGLRPHQETHAPQNHFRVMLQHMDPPLL